MPAPPDYAAAIRRALSEGGISTSSDLQAALGISQPTVSRALRRIGGEVLQLGRGPARRYALAREVPRVGARVGVYSIASNAAAKSEGELRAIARSGYWFEPAAGSGRAYASLPWFALDQRPEGFLGRALARAHPKEGLPSRLGDWNDNQILVALTTFGGSARGDLVFGDRMLEEAQLAPRAPTVSIAERGQRYPELAAAAAAGDAPGSSAGGEQPKFEALRQGADGVARVIVKFSPPIDTPAGTRWMDLLMLEQLANELLGERSIPASASEVMIAGGRAFLEVERFDRVGERGRVRVFSLGHIDDEFLGARQSWAASAQKLVEQDRLAETDRASIAFVDAFGLLIANSDMHFGNLSFFASGLEDPEFRLAPIYDMSPMLYAPTIEVANPIPGYRLPPTPGPLIEVWPDALEAAVDYWERAAMLQGLGNGLRLAAEQNATVLRGAPR